MPPAGVFPPSIRSPSVLTHTSAPSIRCYAHAKPPHPSSQSLASPPHRRLANPLPQPLPHAIRPWAHIYTNCYLLILYEHEMLLPNADPTCLAVHRPCTAKLSSVCHHLIDLMSVCCASASRALRSVTADSECPTLSAILARQRKHRRTVRRRQDPFSCS